MKAWFNKAVAWVRSPEAEHFLSELRLRPFFQGFPYWVSAVAVGFVAIIFTGMFTGGTLTAKYVLEHNRYYLYILSPVCMVLATWVVRRFAPMAGGTGIPKVHRALSLEFPAQAAQIEALVGGRVAVVVFASSVLCALAGGALGQEGPMVHIAACLFYVVGRRFKSIWPLEEHRSWIIAGSAAGIAAAFNAPLAGVVFVLEELSQQHFQKFKTAVISAAIIGGIISQWLTGRYLFLEYAKIGEVPLSSVPWALALGVVCGLLAVPFHWMLSEKFQSHFTKYLGTPIRFAVFSGLVIATLAIFVSPYSIGGGVMVMRKLLSEPGFHADWGLIVSRYLATIFSHLSGCSGGFLAPSLALGGVIGSKFAALTDYHNHSLLVMVGMAAFLSSIVRAPFTAWVIVMEMTDRHSAIFPLMVASLVSSGTVRWAQEAGQRWRQKSSSKNLPPPPISG